MRLLTIALVLIPAVAFAEDVTFSRGGPKAETAKQAIAGAIAASRGDMAPCWRKTQTAVDVAITTDASGAVTSAAARTDGPVAQCVAGILAVATLPKSAGAWSGVVTIAPVSASSGGDADLGALLGKHQAELRACQKVDPKANGIVEVDLRVHPDGTITDVAVSKSLSAALDACLTKALSKITLGDYHGKEVRYRLGLSFMGGGSDDSSSTGTTVNNAPAPTKRGPLEVGQMQPVIEAHRVAIDRCGAGVKASGTLIIRFTVRKDGTTKNLGVKQSIGDAKVEACVLDQFGKLVFPKATDETQVQFPLSFVAP
ncbi:MAG TPA: hypothetical protein VL463_14575 [Kofleriaceae bacterium]|nr:hypothetical protein [Kofleriaceae bacterium]